MTNLALIEPSVLPSPTGPDSGVTDLRRALRMPILIGITVIAVFFAGLGGWAALAPLASAAVASGVISPDGSRRTVQHLEGGIIDRILVRDGDRVEAGDPLLILRDIQASAQYDQLLGQYTSLAGAQARLLAEQAGRPKIDFPEDLMARVSEPEVAEIIKIQNQLFDSRRQSIESRESILKQRIAQLQEEIGGLEAQIESQTTQLSLIEEELADVSELVGKGLERRPRLLALQRTRAEIMGSLASNEAQIARSRQAIGEAELEILNLDVQRQDEVADELVRVQSELAMVQERLRASRDVLDRTVIEAPASGEVVQLRFKTAGGVISPGDPILDIVPEEDELLIDARVNPVDIDMVHPGLEAQVHLTAYRQRNLPRISGTVRTVSADALTDEHTGDRFYLARIEVDRERLHEIAPEIELVPGMPADVLIVTGERTALGYFLEPFLESLNRAFRES